MVASSRKTASSGPIRALNVPKGVEVEEDDQQKPLYISLGRRKLQIAAIEDMWEVEDEWWRRTPIARRYYRVTVEDGPCVTLFRDHVSGGWYKQGA